MKRILQCLICGMLLATASLLHAQQARVMNYLPMSGGGSYLEGVGNSFLEYNWSTSMPGYMYFLHSHMIGGVRPGHISRINPDLTYNSMYPQQIFFELRDGNGNLIQSFQNFVFTEAVMINENNILLPQQMAVTGHRGFNGQTGAGSRMPFVAILEFTENPQANTVFIRGQLYDLIPDDATNICNPPGTTPIYNPFYITEPTVGIKFISPSSNTAMYSALAVVVNGLQNRMHSCSTCPVRMHTTTSYLFQISNQPDSLTGLYRLTMDRPLDMFSGNTANNTWIGQDMEVHNGYLYTLSSKGVENVITRSRITTFGPNQLPTLDPTDSRYVRFQSGTGTLGLHKILIGNNNNIFLAGNFNGNGILIRSSINNLFVNATPSVLNVTQFTNGTTSGGSNTCSLRSLAFDRIDNSRLVVNFMVRPSSTSLYQPYIIQFNTNVNSISPVVGYPSHNAVFFNQTLNGYPQYLSYLWNPLVITSDNRTVMFTGALGCPITFQYRSYSSAGLGYNPANTCVKVGNISTGTPPALTIATVTNTFAKDTDVSLCQISRRVNNAPTAGIFTQLVCAIATRPVADSGIDADDKPTQEQFLLRLNMGCSTPVGLNSNPAASYQFEINENTNQQRDRLTLNGQLTEPCEMSALLLPGVSNTIIRETTLQDGAYLKTERFTFIPKPASDLLVYPNPAAEQVTLLLTNGLGAANQLYQITDLYGKLVKSGFTNGTQYVLTVDDLSAGIYQVTVLDTSGRPHTQRLTITR